MTTHRLIRLPLASLLACAALSATAQGLRIPPAPAATAAPAPSARGAEAQKTADYIVAVVNSEPITSHQLRTEVQRAVRQLAQPPADERELVAQVLERLIADRTQLHFARESGIKVDAAAVDEAEQNIARQNQIDLEELQRRLVAEGIERTQFRNQLRDQLILSRLRDREVNQKVRVSELEIDQFMREQQQIQNGPASELNLAQVLVALAEGASAAQIAAAQAKAQSLMERAKAGEDFATLARQQSDAPDAQSGGEFGMRRADRYPELFITATRGLAAGALAVARSDAGFHVLKVLERRSGSMPASSVVQTRAAHILLRPAPQFSEAAAMQKLADLRKRVLAGQADFAALAKENSQDGSAAQGGDLGWASQGQFVPEFEEAMNRLSPGQLSEPLMSRFGAHLISLTERRTVQLSPRELREAVRSIVRERKTEDAFVSWAKEVRSRAYVEMREPPG